MCIYDAEKFTLHYITTIYSRKLSPYNNPIHSISFTNFYRILKHSFQLRDGFLRIEDDIEDRSFLHTKNLTNVQIYTLRTLSL